MENNKPKKLLVVVDMQNDFIDGALGFESAKELIPIIVDKINKAKENGDNIILTQDTHIESTYENTREGKNLPIKHCLYYQSADEDQIEAFKSDLKSEKNAGWHLNGEIMKALSKTTEGQGDYLIIKKYDSFGLNFSLLYEIYRIVGDIDEIEVCGLVTNLCVLSVTVSLQNTYNNAQITVDANAVKSFDENLHEKALDIMESLQIKVVNRN